MVRKAHSILTAASAVALWMGALVVANQDRDGTSPKIWQGVYTDVQAARGKAAFIAHCASCHSADLTGAEAPPLVGSTFVRNWGSRSLDRLFRKVQGQMPPTEASSVADADKIDILSFLLQMNGFPGGTETLRLDSALLSSVLIVGKAGLQPPPSGATVEVIGCLEEAGNNWQLIHSTEPVVSTIDDPTADAKAAIGRRLGTMTVALIDVFPRPDAHRGHMMRAKGLLIRDNDTIRLNVIRLEHVATMCPL